MRKLGCDVGQQSPVATSPSVDALLHVAHNQVLRVAVAHRLLQQHLEVLPLHGRGVLELVNHDVFKLGAYLLEDERRVAAVYQVVEQLLRVAQQEPVGRLVQGSHLPFYSVEQSELVQVSQREVG